MYVNIIILYIQSRVYYYKEILGDYLWLSLDYWINHCFLHSTLLLDFYIIIGFLLVLNEKIIIIIIIILFCCGP